MICGDRWLDLYVSSAKAHGDASVEGDHTRANVSYDELIKCFKELRKSGKAAELLGLLNHSDPNVRLWAATHSLELDGQKAVAVLRELATADHFSSFSAQIILDQWEKGEFVAPE